MLSDKQEQLYKLLDGTLKDLSKLVTDRPFQLKRANGGPFSDEVIELIYSTNKKLRNTYRKFKNSVKSTVKSSIHKESIKKFIKQDGDIYEDIYNIDSVDRDSLLEEISSKIDKLQKKIEETLEDSITIAFLLGNKKSTVLLEQIPLAAAKKLKLNTSDLTENDLEEIQHILLEQKEYLESFMKDLKDKYEELLALDEEYDSEETLLSDFDNTANTSTYRIDMYSIAAVESAMVSGFILDSVENGVKGGIWHTMHDGVVCDDCEELDDRWMSWEEFKDHYGNTQCNGRCRCGELFEPTNDETGKSNYKYARYFIDPEGLAKGGSGSGNFNHAGRPGEVTKKSDDILLPVCNIHRPHKVKDENKLEEIRLSMQKDGWQGRPLLVEKDHQDSTMYWAWSGSHRITAARLSGLEKIPVKILDIESLEKLGYKRDISKGYLRGIGNSLKQDEAKYAALLLANNSLQDLMKEEILSNLEQRRKVNE